MFKDVYREVGMLEVFVTCLHRFAALLKDPQADGGRGKIKFLAHQIMFSRFYTCISKAYLVDLYEIG